MARNLLFHLAAILFCVVNSRFSPADEKQLAEKSAVKMTAQELADWIDKRFEDEYQKAGTKPGDVVDDATFLRLPKSHPLLSAGPGGSPIGVSQED